MHVNEASSVNAQYLLERQPIIPDRAVQESDETPKRHSKLHNLMTATYIYL